METPDEFFVGSNDQIHMASVKGRRTKRQRVVTTSSTTCGGGGGTAVSTTSSSGAGGGGGDEDFASSSSHTLVSHEEIIIDQHQEMSTEEEEDMANCLIMLAQGDGPDQSSQISVSVSASATTQSKATTTAVGFYVYECKTCNRTFPSFQALGGHRASHKKPKPTTIPAVVPMATAASDEKIKKLPIPIPIPITRDESKELQFNKIVPVQITNKPTKIHECSICGLEFTSGQALGGHMRRHRAAAAAVVSSTQVSVSAAMNMQDPTGSGTMETEMKRRNILQLDLNLPAPEEDLRETKFQFTATPQTIIFSSPTLVDCHY